MLGDDPRYGWRADVVGPCHIGTGLTACNHAFGNLAPFGGVEFLATAAYASLRPSGGKTGGGALTNHRSFELREGTDHLHHHAPDRGCGVDVLGDRTKASNPSPSSKEFCELSVPERRTDRREDNVAVVSRNFLFCL